MKLYYKLTFINAFTRILIIAAFLVFVPSLIYKAAILHTDSNLEKKKTQLFHIIDKKGMGEFMQEESDSTYADYTIFKERYVSIERVEDTEQDTIITSPRDIEGEVLEYRILKHYFQYNKTKYLLELGESIQYVKDLNQILREVALYLLIVLIAVMVILDLSITQYLLRPLHKIENKLIATRHPEKFDYRRVVTTTTDFRYLDNTISDMMRKIQNAFHIEKEFIANVSHELLTPISILQTRLENMIEAGNLNEEAEQKILESQRTLGRLKQIVRSLLLISQIENNQAPKADTVNITEVLKEVAEEIEVRLSEKNISLELNLGEDFTYSPCNRSLLFTMFFNLVNNAVKYNNQNGRIFITATVNRNECTVSIRDTGKGIPQENMESIFYRFKKFNTTEESYGLGLAMVKTIADFHRIDIIVDSKVGEGSTFTLLLKNA
ncbi:MAG TPA: HAMP domain-containing sensor histidine kinase [Bacteroidia bacterium]|jgi:two-component system sensor histidine kinase ArlS|nr:HAMP domain-containing sensor histidine kinase [Bacteroidia bacterium]